MARPFRFARKIIFSFITSGTHEKLELEQRRRLIVLNSLLSFGSVLLIVYGLRAYVSGDNLVAVLDVVFAAFLVICLMIMRILKSNFIFSFTAYLSIALNGVLFLFLIYTAGSDLSKSLWLLSYPLIVIFILGMRAGILYSGIAWVCVIFLFFVPGVWAVVFEKDFKVRYIGVYILITSFSIIYESIRRQIQTQLFVLSNDLLIEKKQTDSIMNNVDEGVFLLNADLKIGTKYSRKLESIFEQDSLSEKSIIELLGSKIPEKVLNALEDYLEMFFRPRVNLELLRDINPVEKIEMNFMAGGAKFKTKYLEFLFDRIKLEGGKVSVLTTVRDVTEEESLALKLREQEDYNARQMENLFQIIHIAPEVMGSFIEDAEAELDNINSVLKSETENYNSIMDPIYQSIHSIKGNAVSLGLKIFAKKIHSIEDKISELKKINIAWKDLLELTVKLTEIQYEIDEIKSLINKVVHFQKKLVDKDNDKKDIISVSINGIIESELRETGRIIDFDNEGFNINLVPDKYSSVIKNVFIQMARNSISHGIEPAEERLINGKRKRGKIIISSKKDGDEITLIYRDDGRGLDLEDIRRKASKIPAFSKMDFDSMNRGRIVNLIFHPGFSTNSSPDLSSGRGMGMNIIKSSVEKIGGKLKVRYTKGKYMEFQIIFRHSEL